MVSFKENKYWKSIVFDFQVSGDLTKAIMSKLWDEEGNLKTKDINIIDMIISSSDPYDANEYSRVVVIYTSRKIK